MTPDAYLKKSPGLRISLRINPIWIAAIFFGLNAPEAQGRFQVIKDKIYDPDGKEFVIKGVNINGPGSFWPIESTQHADLIAKVWKFNFVRVVSVLGGRYTDNNDIDKLIKEFTDRKVVTMFEVHNWTGKDDQPSGGDLDRLTKFHVDIAKKHKNNSYVWFNVMNEPGKCSEVSSHWLKVHSTVLKAIRATGADNIVVADGWSWGQESGCKSGNVPESYSAVLKYGPELAKGQKNVVFSYHIYHNWQNESKMKDYLDRVAAKDLAIFVGEYGLSVQSGAQDAKPSTECMFRVLPGRKVGRVVWHWYGGDDNTLTKTSNPSGGWKIDKTDGSKPGNLTWLGNLVWDDNRRQEKLDQISPTALRPAQAFHGINKARIWTGSNRFLITRDGKNGALELVTGDGKLVDKRKLPTMGIFH